MFAFVRPMPAALAAWVVAGACTLACSPTKSRSLPPSTIEPPRESVAVIATVDLPHDDPRSHELSGIAWDARRGVALAVSDEVPQIVELVPSADFVSWSLGTVTRVSGIDPWDGEGIAIVEGRRFLANEQPARVVELDDDARVRADLPLPEHFRSCRRNRCLESLSPSPDGRYLFTANESTLATDGAEPSTESGSLVRIVRFDLSSGARREWLYLTDPICAAGSGGEIGVTDLAALGDTDLLVLERAYVPNVKNCVRVFRTHLASASGPVAKQLLFDVANLDPTRPFIPNYEGMGLGPRLPDGRRLLFLVSDDNARATQRAALLVVALPLSLFSTR